HQSIPFPIFLNRKCIYFLSFLVGGEKVYAFPVQEYWERNCLVIRDFGGGIKKGEPPLHACLREFEEETLAVFKPYVTDQILNNSKVYVAEYTMYIFINLGEVNPATVSSEFENIRDRIKNDESVPECLKETHKLV